MFCTQEVVGSNPTRSTVTEAKAVEALVCESSISEFESRQSPQIGSVGFDYAQSADLLMEGTAKWLATGLENQGGLWPRGSIPLLSAKLEAAANGSQLVSKAGVRRCRSGSIPPVSAKV